MTGAGTAPAPPTPPTVATALVELLKVEGVGHIFGIPGGALIAMLAALKADPDVTYHTCRQETGAAYMADGYSRVSGGLGVVLVTSGPGATNALTGAMNADASHSPLLVLTGEVKEQFFGRGFLQEGVDAGLDVVAVYRDALGYSEIITNVGNAQELFASAMRRAWGTPRRATHLSLPNDVAATPAVGFSAPPSPAAYRATNAAVDGAGVAAAVQAIVGAKRPLLMLGDDCRRALTDAASLASFISSVEHLSLPVMTSPNAKGLFPETHELSLRNYGIAGCLWPKLYLHDAAAGQYDALVVIGSELGELATNTWDPVLVPDGPFVQIDEDPSEVGRAFPITLGVVGETTAVIKSFVEAANAASVDPSVAAARRALLATIKTQSPFVDPEKRTSTSVPIKPQALAVLVNEAVPSGGHLMVDAGNCVGWCLHEMVIDPPTQIHSALTMGPMGFATAAVVGAKLAAPGATCLAVVGDGGFLMQIGEIATAAQYGVGAIWVVLADHDLAMVSQGMAAVTGDTSYDGYYTLGWTDLAAAARGLGAAAWDVSTVDEATDALRQAVAGAAAGVPQVVVAAIDTTEMPPYSYPPPPPPPPS